jgi:methylphosphotriester-DNA--protein-cysteine methyltransferase
MIRLFAAGGAALLEPSERVAQNLNVSRSKLYRSLKANRLPGIGRWQMLFRLMQAAEVLSQGGSSEDAAFRASLADDRSLRRAFVTHLALTLAGVRGQSNWKRLVDRWIERNTG